MAFKDKLVYCETARRSFFDTIREQRARAERGETDDAPVFCSICKAQVSLAAVPADEHAEEGDIAISALVREGCAYGSVEIGGGASSNPAITTPASGGARGGRRGGGRASGARESARENSSPETDDTEATSSSRRRKRGGRKRAASPDRAQRGRGGGGGGRRGGGRRGGNRREAPRQTDLRIRHVGTVKWFNPEKGYGFIAQDDGTDLFVHTSSVISKQSTELYEGQPVEYEVETAQRGQHAVYVVPLG